MTESTFTAQEIADYFEILAGQPIPKEKLHCLLYLAYGWAIALYGEPLFNNKIIAGGHHPIIEGF